MKKPLPIILICIAAICLISVICIAAVQSSKMIGEEGLIARARKEIKDLAEVESIEMSVAGSSATDSSRLFWIITGNEYQMHRYYPLEVTEPEKGVYKLVRLHKVGIKRAQDIYFEYFGNGYSFVVNNPKCTGIVIDGKTVAVPEIPFVYYHPLLPHEYYFIDADGNELY